MPTRKWGSEKLVNTILSGSQLNSDVAALTGGGFVVVWQEGSGANSSIQGQRYDALGNRAGGEFVVIGVGGVDQLTPTVTGLADGGFFVSWDGDVSSNRDILGKVYNSNGGFVREQHSTPIETAPDQSNPDVARLGTGSVAVWEQPGAGDTDIHARIFGADGSIVNTFAVTSISGREEIEPAVASAPGGHRFVVVWKGDTDFGDVYARVFDAAGNADPAQPFNVSQFVTGPQSEPVVTWLNDARFVVAWRDEGHVNEDSSTIRARVFNFFGQPITDEIAVNATTASQQVLPTITALPNGGFVIAWLDTSNTGGDDSGGAIRLQAFDASGGKIGGEFLVNTTTAGDQETPSISALPDGRVVVTWTDSSSGAEDIRMQIVDPRDGIVTGTGASEALYGHELVNDEISGFGGNDTLNGLNGDDALYGGEGNDLGEGGRGEDLLYGGTGNDTLAGGRGEDLLDGEAGSDYASYAASTGVRVALDGSLAATGEAAGDTLAGIERLLGSTTGGDTLRGSNGANVLNGQGGDDLLQGLNGNDQLIGGLGADTLTGGANADTFRYDSTLDGGDAITDFSAANDQFLFRGSAFGALLPGVLAAGRFQSRADNLAQDTNDRFIFNTSDETLWFDANGSGGGANGAPVLIADLQASATMTSADIVIF